MGIQLGPNVVIAERFHLNRLLGRGGMGSVWHATHLGLDIPCAVKFIEGEFSQVAEAQARFEREAKAAAALRSPHVVQILDHGVFQGTPYIAMELLDGEDLGKRLQAVGRMQPNQLITVITQVCRALTKAHAGGIVHRDLKPDNIFLVRDDDREIAKVLDFGIAKANANAIEGSGTKTGAMLGTPYYMSPEQAQGTRSVDFRSDLWSLAVIVYQCVTGRLPFESEALGDLLVKIIVNPIPVPSQQASDITPAFDRWWARAASREPSQRFQSAKEFGESLGLIWGVSQMTDVMDRDAIRARLQAGQGGAPLGNTPQPAYLGQTPHPGYLGNTPQPNYPGNTPQPGYPGNTPQPQYRGNTPQPGYPGQQQGGFGGTAPVAGMQGGMQGAPLPTTGAPVAHTYNGMEQVALPKKGGGAVIGISIAAAVIVLGGIAAVVVAVKGHGDTPSTTAAQVVPSVSAVAANPPPPPPPPEVASTPPAADTAPTTASADSAPSAVAAQKPALGRPAGFPKNGQPPSQVVVVPTAKPTATVKKPDPPGLGF
jgi:serine/threonine protein kinase